MSTVIEQQIVTQLQSVITAADQIIAKSRFDDLSDLNDMDVRLGLSRLRAAIERLSSSNSSYTRDLDRIDKLGWIGGSGLSMYRGIAQSLLDDAKAGYSRSLEELIHGNVFADYFEMADHLLEAAYKDAAAVIGGSMLEGHLRNLCRKHGIDTDRQGPQGNSPKKADTLNAELAAANVYGKLDQKNVTAWLDLRNKAAHGHYTEYSKEQVGLFLASVRDFVTRLPA
jgi:hypothetical protein